MISTSMLGTTGYMGGFHMDCIEAFDGILSTHTLVWVSRIQSYILVPKTLSGPVYSVSTKYHLSVVKGTLVMVHKNFVSQYYQERKPQNQGRGSSHSCMGHIYLTWPTCTYIPNIIKLSQSVFKLCRLKKRAT